MNELLQAGADLVTGFLNFVVSGAVTIAVKAVQVALQPVLDAIAHAAGLFAVASRIMALIRSWSIRVEPASAVVHKTVAGGPAESDRVTVTIDVGTLKDWPIEVSDCAKLSNVESPSMRAVGDKITWKVDQLPPDLVTILDQDAVVDGPSGGVAIMNVEANHESAEIARGAEHQGPVYVATTIRRSDYDKLRDGFTAAVTRFLGSLVGPLQALLAPALTNITGGITEIVSQIIVAALDEHANGEIGVIYHGPPDNPTPLSGASYTMLWLPTTQAGRPDPPPVIARYTCGGPAGRW